MRNVFSCLTGERTAGSSFKLYDELDVAEAYEGQEEIGLDKVLECIESTAANNAGSLSTIEPDTLTLTICNLASYDETRITSSNSFKKVPSTVTDLKLSIATEECENTLDDVAMFFEEQCELMESPSKTWLAPDIAKNLRILYLHCDAFWGWLPRMDFRDIPKVQAFLS